MSSAKKPVLSSADWRHVLAEACRAEMRGPGPVMVCLTGPAGAGKTTLGHAIRKKGLPGIPRRRIAVIDDGVMSVDFLGFSAWRVRHKTGDRDNLAPFAPWLRGKTVVVFVAICPWERIDRCDVLMRVHCSGSERARRQSARGKKYTESVPVPPDGWIGAARVLELTTG